MPTITLPAGPRSAGVQPQPKGVSLYYRLHAGGPSILPPLVLVHGAGGNHMHWPGMLRRLAGATVYSLDLPGHGKSDGPPRADIAEYAEVIAAFAAALHLPRFVLAGHSMGGAIAVEYALRYSERPAGLVLIGTGGRPSVAPRLLDGLLTDSEHTTELLAAWAHGLDPDPAIMQVYVRRLREVSPEVIYGDFVACDRFDRLADLGRIHVPTLVLCGEADRMTPVAWSRTLAEGIPGAQLAVILAAGHMVMLERPAEVAEQVMGWLGWVFATRAQRTWR